MIDRLAKFATTKTGKWIIGAVTPALGLAVALLINSVQSLGLPPTVTALIGAMLGSVAGRFGIPAAPSTSYQGQIDGVMQDIPQGGSAVK